jgi:hypothetical protein
VRSAVISDLHLGTVPGNDLLRIPAMRERLFEATADVDRLVILGDLAELREAPVGHALETVYEFIEHVNSAFAGRQVVITAGNHDHPLVAAWLEGRRLRPKPHALPVDSCVKAPRSGPLGSIVRRMPDCEVMLAYPGLRLREDVYATHGHYLDRHVTIPGFEPLAIRASERLLRRGGARLPGGAEGYETVMGPVFGLLHEWAQAAGGGTAHGAGASQRAYRMLTTDGRRSVRRRMLGGIAYPVAIAAINAAGLGPVRADLSGPELRRASLLAFGETLRRLDVRAEHVVLGHTHRAGPLPHDDPNEWRHAGARIVNAGSWVYEAFYLGPDAARSPYWPGTVVIVGEDGPPELRRLLLDRTLAELAG